MANDTKRDVLIISLNKKSQEYFSVAPGEQPLNFMGYKAKVAENTTEELQTKIFVIDREDYIFHVSADHNRTNGGVFFDALSTFKFTK